MGLLCVKKQKNLLKLWANKRSVQIMGGLTGEKKREIIVYKRLHGAEKSSIAIQIEKTFVEINQLNALNYIIFNYYFMMASTCFGQTMSSGTYAGM
jgi:hypothetical protein